MHREIIDQQNVLNHLFEQAERLQDKGDVDYQIGRRNLYGIYADIRASSFVEFSVKTILKEYVKAETKNAPYA